MMVKFNNLEKYDMVECYILCHKNAVAARNNYHQTFPERRVPNSSIFPRLEGALKNYGSFTKVDRIKHKFLEENTEINILALFSINPRTSIRAVAEEQGVSKTTVHRLLKEHNYRPYKLKVVQELHAGDKQRRLQFCQWFLRKQSADLNFVKYVLWSDEASFSNKGLFNKKNNHYWSKENPFQVHPGRPQQRFSINVWVGILGTKIIGPYFYRGTLNWERYLNFLNENIEDEFLDNLPLNIRQNLYFQQDGAPPHNSNAVMQKLNTLFNNKWIGTHSTRPWPPRSPDITPLDFFLWGCVKDEIYKKRYTNVNDLQQNITQVINDIDRRTLKKVMNSTVKRVQKCIECEGADILNICFNSFVGYDLSINLF